MVRTTEGLKNSSCFVTLLIHGGWPEGLGSKFVREFVDWYAGFYTPLVKSLTQAGFGGGRGGAAGVGVA